MSEDLVSKGAYLSEEEDIELIVFLMTKAQPLVDQKIEDKRQNIIHAFSELGVQVG